MERELENLKVKTYLIYLINPQYYFLLGISNFSYPIRVSVCLLCLYPHPSDISVTPRLRRFHSIKKPKFYLYLISDKLMKACKGGGDIHPILFILLCNMSDQPRALAALTVVKNPRYPLNMSSDVSQNRSGPFEERKGSSSRR